MPAWVKMVDGGGDGEKRIRLVCYRTSRSGGLIVGQGHRFDHTQTRRPRLQVRVTTKQRGSPPERRNSRQLHARDQHTSRMHRRSPRCVQGYRKFPETTEDLHSEKPGENKLYKRHTCHHHVNSQILSKFW
jgi:hypothetical protein